MKKVDAINHRVNKDRAEYLIKTYFIGKRVFLKTLYEDVRIDFHNYYKGKVVLGIPHVNDISPSPDIYTVSGNEVLNIRLGNLTNIEKNIYLSDISVFTHALTDRNDLRIPLNYGKGNGSQAYITGVTDETLIQNSLKSENIKITRNFKETENELGKVFSKVRCFTVAERVNDPRMEYIKDTNRGYIIRNFKDRVQVDLEGYKYYLNKIYEIEKFPKFNPKYVSEGLIPLLYKKIIPWGYIRFSGDRVMTEQDYALAVSYANKMENFFSDEMFIRLKSRLMLFNLSSSGMSIHLNDKKFNRLFRRENRICFELLLPDNKIINMSGKIKYNIPVTDQSVRTGVEIDHIEDSGREIYSDFIETLK